MNWLQQNRFLGTFVVAVGVATLATLIFLWMARSSFENAKEQFGEQAMQMGTLQRHTPFPTESNLRKMKRDAEEYAAQLEKLKADLKGRALPVVPMAPNEFQNRLRQAVATLTEKARANQVKLPENFYLGFEEFSSALPDTAAAPLLGQQLAQVELLLDILIDARIDAVTLLRRVPASANNTAASPTPIAGRKPVAASTATPPLIERSVIEAAFVSSPGASRRVVNQVSTAKEQFYIIRTLHVLNEKEKGPSRGGVAGATPAAAPPGAHQSANSALNFIVGNERITTSARIEMVRFAF
jgi:hypothetical protein